MEMTNTELRVLKSIGFTETEAQKSIDRGTIVTEDLGDLVFMTTIDDYEMEEVAQATESFKNSNKSTELHVLPDIHFVTMDNKFYCVVEVN